MTVVPRKTFVHVIAGEAITNIARETLTRIGTNRVNAIGMRVAHIQIFDALILIRARETRASVTKVTRTRI